MLQSFLSKNNVSLVNNLNLQPLKPSQHQFKKPCCEMFTNKENKIQRCETQISKSPTYKRKKIFQAWVSGQSQLAVEFKKIGMTESVVQAYKAPKDQEKSQDVNLLKKKGKTNKQNGLCLAKGRLQIKHEYRGTLSTIESENIIRFQGKLQKNVIKMINQKEESENSLQVEQGQSEIFAFNSQGTISSFNYSQSENGGNNKSQYFLRVSSQRNELQRKAKAFF